VPSRKLSTYLAKRDFSRTSEPKHAKAARGKAARFVIQMHDAKRLHYDLRLEHDGVFKSWAVTRGPSLDPAQKRLAVEVEDHPLTYGDFEGTIPKGQYGGGTVSIWDRGYWLAHGDVAAGLKRGEIKFALDGQKLKGLWTLVRLKTDRAKSGRTNWLLIKKRDEYATETKTKDVLDDSTSVASGRSIAQIAAGRGRKPSPFIARGRFAADAVWHSKRRMMKRPPLRQKRSQQDAPRPQKHHAASRSLKRPLIQCRNSFRRNSARSSRIRHPAPDGFTKSSSTATASSCASRTAPRPCGPARGSTGRMSSRRSPPRPPGCRIA
jgi:bifunctional non-homologous end joining protein LigD